MTDSMGTPPLFRMKRTKIVVPEREDSPGVRLRKRRENLITRGLHPLANVLPGLRLLIGAPRKREQKGPRCGDCAKRFRAERGNRSYNKCELWDSHSTSSDLRLWWPACMAFKPNEEAEND